MAINLRKGSAQSLTDAPHHSGPEHVWSSRIAERLFRARLRCVNVILSPSLIRSTRLVFAVRDAAPFFVYFCALRPRISFEFQQKNQIVDHRSMKNQIKLSSRSAYEIKGPPVSGKCFFWHLAGITYSHAIAHVASSLNLSFFLSVSPHVLSLPLIPPASFEFLKTPLSLADRRRKHGKRYATRTSSARICLPM